MVYTRKLFSICTCVVLAELQYKQAVIHFHCRYDPYCPRILILISVVVCGLKRKLHSEQKSHLKTVSHGSVTAA